MLDALKRWLRREDPAGGAVPAGASLDSRLRALEREAEGAASGFRGSPLNRAGDLCVQAGDPERGLRFYGRAIDAFLQDDQPDPARGVAQKIIRLHPSAVRTHCTLTWLDLALGHVADARRHLDDYVAAAEGAGHVDLAVREVVEMARTAPDPDFRTAAADALRRLAAEDAAAEAEALDPDGGADPEQIRDRCCAAAARSGPG